MRKLPVYNEDFILDIYMYLHFHYSSKRKQQFKEYQEFTSVEPKQLLKFISTRWLSLLECVKRIIHQWPALKSYFASHPDVERVQKIKDHLNNPSFKLNFFFSGGSIQGWAFKEYSVEFTKP